VESDYPKLLLTSWVVKGEIASPNCPHFEAEIADFDLNYCIPVENSKNNISGSTSRFFGEFSRLGVSAPGHLLFTPPDFRSYLASP
jgi:hypothetical protein